MNNTIYFDNAATTFPKPEEVYSFMDMFYRQNGANVGRGQYEMADTASGLVKETRQLLLGLFNCPQKQVIFTPSATEGINVVLQGLKWRERFTVYITPFEHNAILRTLHYLSSVYDLQVIELEFNKEEMQFDLEAIKYQFQSKKPDVVVMSHASNVCGLTVPIKDICNFAKKYDSITIIDMAQTAGLLQIDLNDIQCDYAIFAGHKTLYGPYGIAGFIQNKNTELKPLLYGGTGFDSANPVLPSTLPERYEVGSQNIYAIAGLNASLKWINKVTIQKIFEKEKEHTQKLLDVLNQFSNIKIVGQNNVENRIGVVSCVFDDYSSDSIGMILSNNDIAVRTGLHCSPNAHKLLGTFPSGTVRFSIGYFNTQQDFKYLYKVLKIIEENI